MSISEILVIGGAAGLGLGAVGVAVGLGLFAVREDHAQARLTCEDTDPACRERYFAAVDAENGGIAATVIGGVLMAAGAAALVLGVLEVLEDDGAAASVACLPTALGAACAGRF